MPNVLVVRPARSAGIMDGCWQAAPSHICFCLISVYQFEACSDPKLNTYLLDLPVLFETLALLGRECLASAGIRILEHLHETRNLSRKNPKFKSLSKKTP